MFDEVDLPLCWPVEVNYHEAKAYCTWRGQDFRLLAEAEYYALRAPTVTGLHYHLIYLFIYLFSLSVHSLKDEKQYAPNKHNTGTEWPMQGLTA